MTNPMQLQRIWAIFTARNKEFFRDRAAFGWNFAFPFLIIIGFGIIFSGDRLSTFKVGVFLNRTLPPALQRQPFHFNFGIIRRSVSSPFRASRQGLVKSAIIKLTSS